MDFTNVWVHAGAMFFSAFCEETAAPVLLTPDDFVDLRDGPLGFELHYRCHCGRPGVVFPKSGASGRCGAPVAA
jgi:hypothetical protein